MRGDIENKPYSIREIEKNEVTLKTISSAGSAARAMKMPYCRVQSPVIIIEFDHHSGVFLCNILSLGYSGEHSDCINELSS